MELIAEVGVDPERARVYEHGWQSWSLTQTYGMREQPPRPASPTRRVMSDRVGNDPPPRAFQGEGLLVLDPGDGGPVRLFAAERPDRAVASIRLARRGRTAAVSADGPVEERSGPTIEAALEAWADRLTERLGVPPPRPAPSIWCSWYHYYTRVSEADVLENLDAMDELALPVDVVQLDDGYQTEIGDWLELSDRFASLDELAARIADRGRRAGVWVAPFLAAERSRLAREHPEWLIGDVSAGFNWGQELRAVDVTHPGAAGYLTDVFSALRAAGFSFFKIDFVYAGALAGRRHDPDADELAAYRDGLRLIREAIGPDAYLLGCGAPLLPSIGLVDAMRVGPDIDPLYEPGDGDLSQPSQRAAALVSGARTFMHGRFWTNDPDCLIARPEVERREEWAAHLRRVGGLRGSSDRLRSLDEWGLATTREWLAG